MDRSYNYVFTDFDVSEESIKAWKEIECRYLIIGDETCPETKRKHFQGYIEFNSKISGMNLQKKIGHKFWNKEAKGGADANFTYSSKEEILLERGHPKQQGKRSDLDIVREHINDGGKVEECMEFCRSMQAYKFAETYANYKQPDRNWLPEVYIFWGEPGTGKTRKAVEEHKGTIIVYNGTFFLGYKNQECVIFDDFDGYCDRQLLLNLLDRYPLVVNIKGGEKKWNPRKIIFTSNINPKDWSCWNSALERRITSVEKFSMPESDA